MKITHLVVHYSATYPDQNITAADIDKMHKARGFNRIGYHYFIRRDGTLEKGRKDTEIGAHVGGQNTGKLGICWAGGIDRKTGPNVGVHNITAAQEATLIETIKKLKVQWPKAKVVGHRDLANTQCPGYDVIPWWDRIEKGVTVTKENPHIAKDNPHVYKPVVTPDVTEGENEGGFWKLVLSILTKLFSGGK